MQDSEKLAEAVRIDQAQRGGVGGGFLDVFWGDLLFFNGFWDVFLEVSMVFGMFFFVCSMAFKCFSRFFQWFLGCFWGDFFFLFLFGWDFISVRL